MSEDKQDKIIFQAEIVGEGQIGIKLHTKNLNLLSTASRLLNLEIDNIIIGQSRKQQPSIVTVPQAVMQSLRR